MKKPKLNIITSPDDILDLILYLEDKDFVAYDIETSGTKTTDEIIGYSICASDNEAFYVILASYNKDTKSLDYLTENIEPTKELLNYLKSKQLLMHNSLFDCSMTESYFKIKLMPSLHTDTMILAHLLDENRRVGLKDLASSILGEESTEEAKEVKKSVEENGGSLTKTNYEMWKCDSQIMAKYGAKDAWLTYTMFFILAEDLYSQNLDKFFYEEESMPLLKGPTYELNTVGIKVSQQGLISLKKQLEAECEEAKAFIYQEITPYIKDKYPDTTKKNKFNIGSSSQLSWLIFGQLQQEFKTLTKEGKNVARFLIGKIPYSIRDKNLFITECLSQVGGSYISDSKTKKIKEPWSYIACDKEILKKLSPKYKWIEKLVEYQGKTKLLTTYVEGIEERLQYGIIYPQFLQHGTTSGRYSSRNPNFQNLPRKDKRIKECIIARPGKIFVGADYSQLEPRVFASVAQDPALMQAFNGDDDFYSVIGMGVYNKTDCLPIKEGHDDAFGIKYPKLRDLSKVIALAATYGATAAQLAPTTGKSIDETQEDMDNYFNKFPKVAKMMTDSHEIAIKQGYVTSLFGRPRRIPEAKSIPKVYGTTKHSQLPYEARGILNLAVNHRIQSTGASICNRSLIAFYDNVRLAGLEEVHIILQVHDEIVVECKEQDAEAVALLLQDAMENTNTLPGVPLAAIPNIAKNLAALK